jgi:hypothetical protein
MYTLIYYLIWICEKFEYMFHLFVDDEVIDTVEVKNTLVKTHNGYVPIKYVHITKPDKVWLLRFRNGYILANNEHPFRVIRRNGIEELSKLKDILIGDYVISENDELEVLKIKKLWWLPSISMCDITVESNDKLYFVNGILTHNCVAPETLIIIDIPNKGQLEIPIFEAYYMMKKKLTLIDRLLLFLFRLNYRLYKIKIKYDKLS